MGSRPRLRSRSVFRGGLPGGLLVPGALILAAAAGLASIGAAGQWRALRAAEDEARVDAGRDAMAAARAIRAATADPRLPERLGEPWAFTLRDGRPVVPESTGWITAPRPEAPDRDVHPALRRSLEAVGRLEFEAERPTAGAYDRILADPVLEGRERGHALLAAAWSAHRLGQTDRRDAMLDRLGSLAKALAGENPEQRLFRDTDAGRLILAATAGRALPEDAVRRLSTFEPTKALGIVDRMRALAPDSALDRSELARIEARIAMSTQNRRALRAVRDRLPVLLDATAPLRLGVAGDVVLYYPDAPRPDTGAPRPADEPRLADGARPAGGRGVVAPVAVLADSLREIGIVQGSSVELALGEPLPADAIPAIPGIGVVPVVPSSGSIWSRPWLPVAIVVSLGGFLVLGLALSIRAIRSEQAALALRTDFLTSVTHELKTPLTSIQLLGEMLQEGRVGDAASRERYHRRLAAETSRLRMTVENVLDLGRAERSETAYDLVSIDPNELVREALRTFEPLAEREDLALMAELPPDGGARVRVDRDAVLQVLLNLLENARRHAAGGRSVRLAATVSRDSGDDGPEPEPEPEPEPHTERGSETEPGSEARPASDMWTLRIRDRGPGVPRPERERIFEKFRRGAAATASGNPGVGLGLYLGRRIVRDHGGDLRYEDPFDGGSGAVFVLTLPTVEAPAEVRDRTDRDRTDRDAGPRDSRSGSTKRSVPRTGSRAARPATTRAKRQPTPPSTPNPPSPPPPSSPPSPPASPGGRTP